MMKKRIHSKNYNKWIIIDIVAIIVICAFALFYTSTSGVAKEELEYASKVNDNLFYIIVLIICSLPSMLGFIAFYFGIRFTIKKIEKRNLTYNANQDILYYRDILGDLTPFDVSILANLNVEEKKDVAATILWYQHKKYIDIKDEQIIFYNNINLTEKDKLFFDYLKTKDLGYLEAYKNKTFEELKSKKYIIENDTNFNVIQSIIKNMVIIGVLFLIIIGLILINVFVVKGLIIEDIIDLVIIIIGLVITYKRGKSFVIEYTNRKSKFRRGKLGEEKTTYIHALQNFIHDFGNLKEYEKNN